MSQESQPRQLIIFSQSVLTCKKSRGISIIGIIRAQADNNMQWWGERKWDSTLLTILTEFEKLIKTIPKLGSVSQSVSDDSWKFLIQSQAMAALWEWAVGSLRTFQTLHCTALLFTNLSLQEWFSISVIESDCVGLGYNFVNTSLGTIGLLKASDILWRSPASRSTNTGDFKCRAPLPGGLEV